VGETAACGTGACAAACAAAAHLGLASPIAVRMPGGLLAVSFATHASVTLAGPVQREGTIEP
jgi:diaminopimelate epimerase